MSSPDYVDLIKRDQINFVCYAAPIAYLRSVAAAPAALIEFCRDRLDVDAVMGVERPPNRIMEVWRFFEMLAIGANPVDVELTLPFSCLARLPNIFRCSDVGAYALTHVIMYLSDFGRDAASLPKTAPRALVVIDALTLRFLAEGHLDLAIELALCHAIVAGCTSTIVDVVVGEAVRRVTTIGTVDMPAALMTSVIDSVPDASKAWAQQYHTMLVLGALLEQWIRVGPASPPGGLVVGGDLDLASKCFVLGEAISAISSYDLYRGCQIANLLARSDPGFETVILRTMAEFVRTLRRRDGSYGYYPDERHFIALNPHRGYDLDANRALAKGECDALLERFSLT